jgi:hypothetical protein
MSYTDSCARVSRSRPLPMALSASLLGLLLVACGGGEPSAAEAGGGAPPSAADSIAQRVASLPAGHLALGLPIETLLRLSRPLGTPHDAIPAGVPPGYDWRETSKLDHGNTVPPGFRAFTGWAQAFWIDGAPVGTQRLELRATQTLLCIESQGARRWQRVQKGDIEGAAFRADFANNDNVPAELTNVAPGQWRVGFGADRAYHFWPRQGRVVLSGEPLCGMLMLFQARAVAPDGSILPPGTAATLLAGGGADYWLSTSAPWDNYRTNIGVGVGHLGRVGPEWAWHGMGTADTEALTLLARDGFVDRTQP